MLFCHSFLWLSNRPLCVCVCVCVCVCHIFIHSSVVGHLSCFYVLAVVLVFLKYTSSNSTVQPRVANHWSRDGPFYLLRSDQIGRSVVSDSLRPHESQHARLCVWAPSCRTLWDLLDCSSPGSSVHGIIQVRILEWVAIPSSRAFS